jgi:hypothetical protein
MAQGKIDSAYEIKNRAENHSSHSAIFCRPITTCSSAIMKKQGNKLIMGLHKPLKFSKMSLDEKILRRYEQLAVFPEGSHDFGPVIVVVITADVSMAS